MPDLNLNTPKRNNGLIKNVIIIVLVLLVICLFCYTISLSSSKNKVKIIKEKADVIKNLDITSHQVTDLYNSVDVFKNFDNWDNNFNDQYLGYFYKKDSIKVTDLPNNVILMIALSNINEPDYKTEVNGIVSVNVPQKKVNSVIDNVFGINDYKHEGEIPRKESGSFKYNSESQNYESIVKAVSPIYPLRHVLTKITRAEKSDKEIVIYVKYIYEYIEKTNKVVSTYYNDLDSQNKLTSVEGQIVDTDKLFTEYSDKLNEYKFTYENKEGSYYFTGVSKE